MTAQATAARRLQKELMDLMMSGSDDISAFPDDDNLFLWNATMKGAPKTFYEGMEFRLTMRFPETYPYDPPVVQFAAGGPACYHPNVDLAHGHICLDILKENWSAVISTQQVLLSIQSLLDNPNNASPLNQAAAAMWADSAAYARAVREAYVKSGGVLNLPEAPTATTTSACGDAGSATASQPLLATPGGVSPVDGSTASL